VNRKKQQTTSNEPTVTFIFKSQTWRRVMWACAKSELEAIAVSIEKRLIGIRPTENVEIAVPISACIGISQACDTHDVGVGIAFATAASSHYVEKVKQKPVSSEALTNAREALIKMETET